MRLSPPMLSDSRRVSTESRNGTCGGGGLPGRPALPGREASASGLVSAWITLPSVSSDLLMACASVRAVPVALERLVCVREEHSYW